MAWLDWIKEYYFFNFFALYIFGGRTAAILSAQWLGQSLLFFFPLVVLLDILQIPLFYRAYEGLLRLSFLSRIRPWLEKTPGRPAPLLGLADLVGLERPGGLPDHPDAGKGRRYVERRPDGFFAENPQKVLLSDSDRRFGGRLSLAFRARRNPRLSLAVIGSRPKKIGILERYP